MQFYIVCFGTILDFLQIVFIEKSGQNVSKKPKLLLRDLVFKKLTSQSLLNVSLFWIITVVIFKLISSPCLA